MDHLRKPNKKSVKLLVLPLLLILSVAAVACSSFPQQPAEPTLAPWVHEIDPTFRRFYQYYGGYDVFGPAISDARWEGEVLVQFTEAVKMVYDPQAPAVQRFRLAPLGVSLVMPEPEVPKPQDNAAIYVDGHIIHPVFAAQYTKLKDILGKPLTEARTNIEYHRLEQFFENMGLAFDLVTSEVRYLAFGVAMCDSRCRKTEPEYCIPLQLYPIDPTFEAIVKTLGSDFTGYPITPGYMTPKGRWQQVFENLVLSSSFPNQPNTVMIETIALQMTYVKDGPQANSGDPTMTFITTQGALGYLIPQYFWQYIQAHGGLEITGAPISQPRQMGASSFVQCFTNLCLEYNLEAIESRSVHPVGLGYPYKTLFGPVEPLLAVPANTPTPVPEFPVLTFRVWDALRTLDTRLQQEIGVFVTLNQSPLKGLEPSLRLTLPDGRQEWYAFPPTGEDGQAILRLPLLEGKNGDVVIYAVCILRGGEQICMEESFLIWNNP